MKKENNKYVANLDLLETAYICEHATMKRFEERGKPIDPFLQDYIEDGRLIRFTRGNEEIINTRAIMSTIDINELKKELYKLLLAYKYSEAYCSKINSTKCIAIPVIEVWICNASTVSDVECIIKKYYDEFGNDRFRINQYIEKVLKQMIKSKQDNDSWLLKPELSVRFRRLIKKY